MHLGHCLDPLPPCLPQFLICSRHREDGSSVCCSSQCPHPSVSTLNGLILSVLQMRKLRLLSGFIHTSPQQKEARRMYKDGAVAGRAAISGSAQAGALTQRWLWGRRMTSCLRLFPAVRAVGVSACGCMSWRCDRRLTSCSCQVLKKPALW